MTAAVVVTIHIEAMTAAVECSQEVRWRCKIKKIIPNITKATSSL